MAWMPGVPRDEDAPDHGTDSTPPIAAVLHRTIGNWGGDYTVIKRDGLAHFLIGKERDQWVQFADASDYQWHAGGANDWSVGVEFSGQNGEPLTDWQKEAGAKVIGWLSQTYGIPLTYNDGSGGRNGPVNQFVAHNYVSEPEDQHTDYINRADWDAMVRTIEGDDEVTPEQMAELGRWMKEQRTLLEQHIDDQIDKKVGQWLKDTENRIVTRLGGK